MVVVIILTCTITRLIVMTITCRCHVGSRHFVGGAFGYAHMAPASCPKQQLTELRPACLEVWLP